MQLPGNHDVFKCVISDSATLARKEEGLDAAHDLHNLVCNFTHTSLKINIFLI